MSNLPIAWKRDVLKSSEILFAGKVSISKLQTLVKYWISEINPVPKSFVKHKKPSKQQAFKMYMENINRKYHKNISNQLCFVWIYTKFVLLPKTIRIKCISQSNYPLTTTLFNEAKGDYWKRKKKFLKKKNFSEFSNEISKSSRYEVGIW